MRAQTRRPGEALALYATHQMSVAAVLTDMAMPIMDGPALCIALKVINPAVRVIGSSGLAAQGENSRPSASGFHQFVPKPYTAEALLKTLHQVLNPSAASEAGPTPTLP